MKLETLNLQNWQPFLGRGLKSTKITLKSETGQKNMIVYAENTHGKTAIWQAIQFGFFGKVNKRKTGWQEGKYRPWIWKNTSGEPLLNQTANEKGDYTFGVIMTFNHDGEDFTLERTCGPRRGIIKPKNDTQMELEELYIRNESEGKIVKEPQKFINDILPYDLAQFFMFDGERLDKYRLLFEDTNDVKLKGYIEAILRFPVLTDGTKDFIDIKKKSDKELRKFRLRGTNNDNLRKEVEELESQVTELDLVLLDEQKTLATSQANLQIVEEWLKQNDKGAEALAQQKIFKKQVKSLEEEIVGFNDQMKQQMPGTWKTIISSRINTRLDVLDGEMTRQFDETKEMGVIEGKIKSLNAQLKGEKCITCGHIHQIPEPTEIAAINRNIISLEKKFVELEKSTISPDPHYLLSRQKALRSMTSTNKLDSLINIEENIVRKKQELRRAGSNYEKAMKLLSSEAIREVQTYLSQKKSLEDEIAISENDIIKFRNYISSLESKIKIKTENIQSVNQTISQKKCEKKIDLLDNLIEVWKKVTTDHRETMRAQVEKSASEIFMSLTNKKKTYKGLRIHSDFRVEILHKKKSREAEAGSGGQSALMAYSILDALTTSSGIEFPMVVDTPARSIDKKNLNRLFDYLFLDSGKQVILLPESKELEPEVGDDKYGGSCAATYEIYLMGEHEDLSQIKLRVNNTGKTNGELGYDV
jgi:DNA sulfur modification protein DndD